MHNTCVKIFHMKYYKINTIFFSKMKNSYIIIKIKN